MSAVEGQVGSFGFTMSSNVVVFDFNDQMIRTLTVDGEVLFRTSDVAAVLGVQTHKLTERMPAEDHLLRETLTKGGPQKLGYLREAGLYRAILRSDKPEVEPFIQWVTRDVIPAIRKTGSYGVSTDTAERITRMENAIGVLAQTVTELAKPRVGLTVQETIFDEEETERLLWLSVREARKLFPSLNKISHSNASIGWMMSEVCRRFNFKAVEGKTIKEARRYHRSAWERLLKEKPWRYVPKSL
jgi:prophage antirepressor-like protein